MYQYSTTMEKQQGASNKRAREDSDQENKKAKLESDDDIYEYVNGKLGGWPRKGRMKALNDASVCALLCFRRMKIPKDVQMLLVGYVRAGSTLALKLERLLKREWSLRKLKKPTKQQHASRL